MASDDLPDPTLLEGGEHHPRPEQTLLDESRRILEIREQIRELMDAATLILDEDKERGRAHSASARTEQGSHKISDDRAYKKRNEKTVSAARRHPKISGAIAGTVLALGVAGYAISKLEKSGEPAAEDASGQNSKETQKEEKP